MKPVLVTGAAGYVGARLVSRLRSRGISIRAAIPASRRPAGGTGAPEAAGGQGEARILPGDPVWAGKPQP